MNNHKINTISDLSLPKRGDSLVNILGYPKTFQLPTLEKIPDKYINTMYSLSYITVDWGAYKEFLSKVKPEFKPHALLVGHDSSEIENITLMALGGVIHFMNGITNYALVGENNINILTDIVKNKQPEWIGFNLYTGHTNFVFKWIKQYKIERASFITQKKYF